MERRDPGGEGTLPGISAEEEGTHWGLCRLWQQLHWLQWNVDRYNICRTRAAANYKDAESFKQLAAIVNTRFRHDNKNTIHALQTYLRVKLNYALLYLLPVADLRHLYHTIKTTEEIPKKAESMALQHTVSCAFYQWRSPLTTCYSSAWGCSAPPTFECWPIRHDTWLRF